MDSIKNLRLEEYAETERERKIAEARSEAMLKE